MEENPAPVDMETLPLFTGFIYQSKVMQDVFHYQYPKPCLRRHLTITNPVHIFTAWIIRVKKTQLPSLTFRCEQKHVTSGLQVCSLNFIYFLTKDTTFWISIIEQISGISNHLLQPRLAWGLKKRSTIPQMVVICRWFTVAKSTKIHTSSKVSPVADNPSPPTQRQNHCGGTPVYPNDGVFKK